MDNKDLIKAAKEALNKTFGYKTEVDMESKIAQEENYESEKTEESKEPAIDIENTWVWVEGYKGTDKDMRCACDFQYELGGKYSMPREEVEECRSGFHLCLNMHDVQKYYSIGKGNRFFKVRALVRLSDKYKYGTYPWSKYDGYRYGYRDPYNKLAAAEIEFLEELTIDEILENTIAKDWEDEYKKMAIEAGLEVAKGTRHLDILMGYGYSKPFACYLINNKKYDVAKAVGSQPDLSMDMKCLMILKG